MGGWLSTGYSFRMSELLLIFPTRPGRRSTLQGCGASVNWRCGTPAPNLGRGRTHQRCGASVNWRCGTPAPHLGRGRTLQGCGASMNWRYGTAAPHRGRRIKWFRSLKQNKQEPTLQYHNNNNNNKKCLLNNWIKAKRDIQTGDSLIKQSSYERIKVETNHHLIIAPSTWWYTRNWLTSNWYSISGSFLSKDAAKRPEWTIGMPVFNQINFCDYIGNNNYRKKSEAKTFSTLRTPEVGGSANQRWISLKTLFFRMASTLFMSLFTLASLIFESNLLHKK